MRVTMVKKRLKNGEPCNKCLQAEEMLKKRGLWEQVDEVVWADENDDGSPGMLLAKEHEVTLAPFFLVNDDGETTVETSALRMAKRLAQSGGGEAKPAQAKSDAKLDYDALNQSFAHDAADDLGPPAVVDWALSTFGSDAAIAFSGAEDVVLIDMAAKTGKPFSVFCLDTGRLHAETYEFLEKVRQHYGTELRLMSPAAKKLEPFVRQKGLFSFYEDGHSECCGIRKVEPLKRALKDYDAWITGVRRDQSPATRSDIPLVAADDSHEGKGSILTKVSPLSRWTLDQVWQYIRANDVPYNPLAEQGFVSIGCQPCTRPPRPGEHERAGRWWWEEATQRECGLHLASKKIQ